MNERLKEYVQLHSFFDAWLLIAVRNAESAGKPLGEPADDSHMVRAHSKYESHFIIDLGLKSRINTVPSIDLTVTCTVLDRN